ncbi:hypothetical protein HanPSC8_Chr17g0749681 [Helianthus annuus]|nr:hypothetical protein HanPSC8_Chr17g0749681 [Helianthus annuus]
MFTSNCRRCPLAQKLTSYVLNVSKSCTKKRNVWMLGWWCSDSVTRWWRWVVKGVTVGGIVELGGYQWWL